MVSTPIASTALPSRDLSAGDLSAAGWPLMAILTDEGAEALGVAMTGVGRGDLVAIRTATARALYEIESRNTHRQQWHLHLLWSEGGP
jgi:hypothetical protein